MSPLSTRTLDALPVPAELWRRSIAPAALDRLRTRLSQGRRLDAGAARR
ncbi:MAG: hypothetical protein R3F62_32150 [Planctomycetota bacterium]